MLNAAAIQQQIRKETESRITVYPCNNLRASNIGHPCERYLYLLIRHWDQQEPHDYGLQNIFDLGNKMEDYTIDKLKWAGLEIITPTQRSWRVDNPFITGREDIRIKDTETGELIPAEIKGLSPFEWAKLDTVEDFYNSRRYYMRGYPAQLLVYMWKFEKEHGFFVLTNKLTGEIKVIDVPFDWDRADALLKKAERIYEALADGTGNTLPAPTDDISVCESCKLKHMCTAEHSRTDTFIDDGELDDLIKQKEALAEGYRKYGEINQQIKNVVGDREKIVTSSYLVTTNTIHKKEYTVKAREEKRIKVSRL